MPLRIAAMTAAHWPEVADTYRQAASAGRLCIFNIFIVRKAGA